MRQQRPRSTFLFTTAERGVRKKRGWKETREREQRKEKKEKKNEGHTEGGLADVWC